MKKLFALLLVCLLSLVTVATAEDLDLANMSLEELVKLRASIDAEINSQLVATATLTSGTYVIGVDIAAGTYILVGIMDKGPSGYPPEAWWAESLEKSNNYEYIDNTFLKKDRTIRITFNDGMILKISGGDCAIQQAPPLLFAPQQ